MVMMVMAMMRLVVMVVTLLSWCSSRHHGVEALMPTRSSMTPPHRSSLVTLQATAASKAVPFKPPIVPPSNNGFSSLDLNRDGRLSMQEIIQSPSTVLQHSPLIKSFLSQLRLVITNKQNISLLEEIKTLVNLRDVFWMSMLILSYRKVFRMLFQVFHSYPLPAFLAKHRHVKTSYEHSLLGHLEQPFGYMLWFPPFLYLVDLLSIALAYLGFQFHIKGDVPRLLCTMAYSIIAGSFLTRIKDWMLYKWRAQWHTKTMARYHQSDLSTSTESFVQALLPSRDPEKEKIIDEISSLAIWFVVATLCLQAFSLELGIGLGSLFALGGVGSASFVWAWRSTMENVVGGLLLKLQDKFRVGDKITVPSTTKDSISIGKDEGIVEEIGLLTTRMRLEDDSHLSVPNALFIQGQVINWSRTPYRLFSTTLKVNESKINQLPHLIEEIRYVLEAEEGIESQRRDLIVAAVGFADGHILIDIKARLKANTDVGIAEVKTRVVDKIAGCMDKICNAVDLGQDI